MKQKRYNSSGLRAQGSGAQGSGLRGEWANFCRLTKGLSLLLLLLFLCGTASAELVYSVWSQDYSIGRVTYDSGGAPQNGNVLENLENNMYFVDTYSNENGEWRILTKMYDSPNYSYSLYDPDKDWKAPLAKTESLRGDVRYQDDNSIYLVSNDNSSYTVSKVDKKTLAVTKASESMNRYPEFSLNKGLIFLLENPSRYGNTEENVSRFLTLLDKDLKGQTFDLDDGIYDYFTLLGDGNAAMTFVSQDVQQVVDSLGYSNEITTITDLGIFKFNSSGKTQIVSANDVGFSASDTWWSIENLTSDKSGGLYFVVNKYGASSSSTLYHWSGSTTTSVFKAGEGENIRAYGLDSSGNVYCSVYKDVWNEQTKTATLTVSLYRTGTSTPVYETTAQRTDGSEFNIGGIESDNSGNVYFTVSKGTYDSTTWRMSYTSYALWRCGASEAKATRVSDEFTDGSVIESFKIQKYSNYSDSNSNSNSDSHFYDGSGNAYFMVASRDVVSPYTLRYEALYRCGATQSKASKLHEEKDGSTIGCADIDDSGNLYFVSTPLNEWRNSALRRCGPSQTAPDRLDPADGSTVSYAGMDGGNNAYFTVSSRDVETLYRCKPSQTTPDPVKEAKDGSSISNIDTSRAGSEGAYFDVFKWNYERVEEDGGFYYRYTSSSCDIYHYNGTDVNTIHTFSDVTSPSRKLDEKHKILYLYANPVDSDSETPLLAFDNADKHNPKLLKEFKVAGQIQNAVLYNDKVSESSDSSDDSSSDKEVIPDKPTSKDFTVPGETPIKEALTPAPVSGRTSVTLDIALPDGTKPDAGTIFYVWIDIISRLSVAANLASEEYGPFKIRAGEDGSLVIDTSKLVEDAYGNKVSFPGGNCIITYRSQGDKFVGGTGEVKLAASSSSDGITSNKGSGGCDAGFGALALTLAAAVLLKKRGK